MLQQWQAPSTGAAGVGVGSQLDHLFEPALDSTLKLVATTVKSLVVSSAAVE